MSITKQHLAVCLVLLLLSVVAATAGPIMTPASQGNRWRPGPIKIAISQSLLVPEPNIKVDSDVRVAIDRAIESWKGIADVDLIQVTSDRLSVSPTGVAGDGISLITIAPTAENILLFKSDIESAAKTRVFVDRRGYISEADIVLSPFLQFSTDGSYGTYDIESTIRHEIGHLLGLRHSTVVGSVMYDVTSRNGVFGEVAKPDGSLAEDDLSAIQDLYDQGEYPNCCGVLNGKLGGMSGKSFRSADLWLEDVATGRIVAHTSSSTDGTFRFGGMDFGRYNVLARESSKDGNYSVVLLGETIVLSDEPTNFTYKLIPQPLNFSAELLGKNGILSDSPLRLQQGGSYSLYIGGRELRSERVSLEAGSPYISIDSSSLFDTAYDDGISGIKFTLSVDARTPAGNYNICAVSLLGLRDCVPGGLVVVAQQNK